VSKTATLAAPRERCWAALAEFDRYAEWQPPVKHCEVIQSDNGGKTVDVETVLDLKLATLRYQLRYFLDEPERLRWELLGGEIVKDVRGECKLEDLGDERTRVIYETRVEVGRLVPGPIRRMLERSGADRFFSDLRDYVEG
jgi:carbon monoxide dehydrogenase subunit G